MTMDAEEEDFTAAVIPPPPPLPPKMIIRSALAFAVILGVVIVGALAVRRADDSREHPNCQTWLRERTPMAAQVAADERAGDKQRGLVHAYQLQEWDKKRPAGCA